MAADATTNTTMPRMMMVFDGGENDADDDLLYSADIFDLLDLFDLFGLLDLLYLFD